MWINIRAIGKGPFCGISVGLECKNGFEDALRANGTKGLPLTSGIWAC